jgi:lipopolysaccharide export system protein LptA
MPQPVQPPKIPAIIHSVSTQDAAIPDQSSPRISRQSASTQTLPTKVLATPTPPESFAPESSSLTISKSAALLGPPISVGSSVSSNQSEKKVGDSANSVLSYSPSSSSANQATTSAPEAKVSSLATYHSAAFAEEMTPAPQAKDNSLATATEPSSTPTTFVVPNVKRLVTQERGGPSREFELSIPAKEAQSPQELVIPSQAPTAAPQPSTSPPGTTTTPFAVGGVIELTSDRQEYDDKQKVVTAVGNVVLRFREALLNADRVEVNLPNRVLIAEGNVALTRGQQVLRGQRFEYLFVQDSGVVLNAKGELYTPTSGTDLDILSPNSPGTPVSDRITSNQPLQGVTSAGGYSFILGAGRTAQNLQRPVSGGTIKRLRYEADRVDFDGKGAVAQNIRITNDPFSPPELELRADTARFTRVEPLVDEIVASRPRLVFDQRVEIPTFRNRITIDRRPKEPGLFNIGYDGGDRGGVFIERRFGIINQPNLQLSVTPQYFIQKAITEGTFITPADFGVKAQLNAILSPRTTVEGRAVFTTLDPTDLENKTRASLQLQQIIGTTLPHTLNLRYSYRDRLFNGSLGFQTVQSSLGAVLTSPNIPLGKTGVNLNYQVGAQYINADTDRLDLLDPVRTNNRISLGRFETSASLGKSWLLWQGQGLPATPTEGLRYTPSPVVPNLVLGASVAGVVSAYTNGDSQESLSGTIALSGQFGHFSRPYLDYTGFNIAYTQVVQGGLSPFLFDRIADTSVLSAGITQQIYGPFRLGIQTAISLNNGQEISTDYLLEYSRRTYNIQLRYNPVQQLGSISFQISDFNWSGNPGVFDNTETRPVIQGVPRE